MGGRKGKGGKKGGGKLEGEPVELDSDDEESDEESENPSTLSKMDVLKMLARGKKGGGKGGKMEGLADNTFLGPKGLLPKGHPPIPGMHPPGLDIAPEVWNPVRDGGEMPKTRQKSSSVTIEDVINEDQDESSESSDSDEVYELATSCYCGQGSEATGTIYCTQEVFGMVPQLLEPLREMMDNRPSIGEEIGNP